MPELLINKQLFMFRSAVSLELELMANSRRRRFISPLPLAESFSLMPHLLANCSAKKAHDVQADVWFVDSRQEAANGYVTGFASFRDRLTSCMWCFFLSWTPVYAPLFSLPL